MNPKDHSIIAPSQHLSTMQFLLLSALAALAAPALALPLPDAGTSSSTTSFSSSSAAAAATSTPYSWDAGYVDAFQIHQSCNATNRNQLLRAFSDLRDVTAHARDHILRYGNTSDIFVRYFGTAASAEPLGWYSKFVSGQKNTLLFRCDDIDGNCKNDGWAGHWRGSNATDETVICDLSYTSRLYNDQICSQGYTVAGSSNALTWAGDLMHRVMHTDSFGEFVTGHYADTYSECLELAKNDTAKAVRNSATLRYFALDAYAYDIAVPGVGCLGTPVEEDDEDSHAATTSTATGTATGTTKGTATGTATGTAAAAVTTTSAASKTTTQDATTAATAGKECHTHDDGAVHCA